MLCKWVAETIPSCNGRVIEFIGDAGQLFFEDTKGHDGANFADLLHNEIRDVNGLNIKAPYAKYMFAARAGLVTVPEPGKLYIHTLKRDEGEPEEELLYGYPVFDAEHHESEGPVS